ncbi:MAG: flagellar hook-length control protein FliK [Planctomycetota bacterium]
MPHASGPTTQRPLQHHALPHAGLPSSATGRFGVDASPQSGQDTSAALLQHSVFDLLLGSAPPTAASSAVDNSNTVNAARQDSDAQEIRDGIEPNDRQQPSDDDLRDSQQNSPIGSVLIDPSESPQAIVVQTNQTNTDDAPQNGPDALQEKPTTTRRSTAASKDRAFTSDPQAIDSQQSLNPTNTDRANPTATQSTSLVDGSSSDSDRRDRRSSRSKGKKEAGGPRTLALDTAATRPNANDAVDRPASGVVAQHQAANPNTSSGTSAHSTQAETANTHGESAGLPLPAEATAATLETVSGTLQTGSQQSQQRADAVTSAQAATTSAGGGNSARPTSVGARNSAPTTPTVGANRNTSSPGATQTIATTAAGEKNETSQTIATRARMVRRLSAAMQRMRPGGGGVRLRMHPEALGSVQLDLQVRGNRVRARVVAETNAAAAAIRDSAADLQRRLQLDGLQMEQLQIETREESASFTAASTHSDQHRRGDTQDNHARSAKPESADPSAADSTLTPPINRPVRSDARVDLLM